MSLDVRLQGILNRLRDGGYVEKFDALSLSRVEVPGIPATAVDGDAITSEEPLKLPGLDALVRDVLSVLTAERIREQGATMFSKAELGGTEEEIGYLTVETYKKTNGGTATGSDAVAADMNSALDIEGIWSDPSIYKLKRGLQECYDTATAVLAAKAYAFERVQEVCVLYAILLSGEAQSCGIRYNVERSKLVVAPRQRELLSHQFFDTAEHKEICNRVINAVQAISCHGSEGRIFIEQELAYKSNTNLSRNSTASFEFGVGFRVGAVAVMVLWSVLEAINNEVHGRETWLDPSFSIFIFTGSALLLLWLFGLTLYIFREKGIDFIALLELDHTSLATMRKPEDVIFYSATGLTLVYLIAFVVFNSALTGVFSSAANPWIAHSLPVFLLMFFFYRMLTPWDEDRRVWFSMLYKVAKAPLTIAVSFRDGLIADILTSLVRVFLSLFFSLSYAVMLVALATTSSDPDAVSTSHLSEVDRAVRSNEYFKFIVVPIITLLPLKIRFVQCLYGAIDTGERWPYFGNALKYGVAIVVISQGLFDSTLQYHTSWLFALAFATIYQYIWDITMDWGLVEFSARDMTIRLRGHRNLGATWVYVAAMALNFILRFAWVLTLVPLDVTNTEVRKDGTPRKGDYVFIFDYLHPTIAVLEIVRRVVWIWFRVEYEQIQSLGAPITRGAKLSNASLAKVDQISEVPSDKVAGASAGDLSTQSSKRSTTIEAISEAAGLGGRESFQKMEITTSTDTSFVDTADDAGRRPGEVDDNDEEDGSGGYYMGSSATVGRQPDPNGMLPVWFEELLVSFGFSLGFGRKRADLRATGPSGSGQKTVSPRAAEAVMIALVVIALTVTSVLF